MDFELNESQRKLVQMVRDFCVREVKPHAQEWDRDERFPREVVSQLGDLGLLGMTVPEELGGSDLDTLSVAAVVEEIARWDGSLALTVASHNGLGTSHLLRFGNDELRQRYIPDIAAGRKLAAWGLTEPGSGSDAAGMRTTAVRKDKGWVLNGAKMFITQGTVGDVFVVLALTDPDKRQKGVTAFLLEKSLAGFSQRPLHGKLGMRSSDTAELVMEDVYVEDWRRIGEVGSGFVDTLKILDKGRITIGALSVGLGRGALEESVIYARERKAFGKSIADFQALRFMMADMSTELDAARLLVQRAANLADQGRRYTSEAAMGKLFASEAACRAAACGVQIHGGYGFTREFLVERIYRDVKLCTIGEGTSEIQRLVIARELLKA
ncbi:MAG TPA: acyl-CoA dehydrogenase family protein [Myxococcales bacterium]|nr:acyl-CoA dehydrogenase family protein [Myxococcales bacterium]